MVEPKAKTLLWSYAAGDRSVMWGFLKKRGQRKTAFRIVRRMEKDLFSKKALKEYEKATVKAEQVQE